MRHTHTQMHLERKKGLRTQKPGSLVTQNSCEAPTGDAGQPQSWGSYPGGVSVSPRTLALCPLCPKAGKLQQREGTV